MQVMAGYLLYTQSLPEPIMNNLQWNPKETTFCEILTKRINSPFMKMHLRISFQEMAAILFSTPCDYRDVILTSANGNIFCVTGPLCGEFIGDQWIPHIKASAWINGWVNNRGTGNLRCHYAHYDITVMDRTRFSSVEIHFLYYTF